MSADGPEAKGHDSRGAAVLLRGALAVLGLAGGVLAIVATYSTVVQIKVLTVTSVQGQDTAISGSDLHGPALAIVGAFAVLMALGALRGARPAMLALAVCGIAVLGVSLLRDATKLDDVGQIGQLYEDASAGSATGFYLETLGGALLLVSGGGLLMLTATRSRDGPQ